MEALKILGFLQDSKIEKEVYMDFEEVRIPLTLKQVDSLYWLGRYTERALTTLRTFITVYDSQLDTTFDYAAYCNKLDICNTFTSLKDFCFRYVFDTNYSSSIIASLSYANGNAMMLREIIGSDALSYMEMSLRTMHDAQYSQSPVLLFQKVIDYIMAFKGTVEDCVFDRNVRNIICCGYGVERLDMYLRLELNQDTVLFECRRLAESLAYTDVDCDTLQLQKIMGELCQVDSVQDSTDKIVLLQIIDSLFAFS